MTKLQILEKLVEKIRQTKTEQDLQALLALVEQEYRCELMMQKGGVSESACMRRILSRLKKAGKRDKRYGKVLLREGSIKQLILFSQYFIGLTMPMPFPDGTTVSNAPDYSKAEKLILGAQRNAQEPAVEISKKVLTYYSKTGVQLISLLNGSFIGQVTTLLQLFIFTTSDTIRVQVCSDFLAFVTAPNYIGAFAGCRVSKESTAKVIAYDGDEMILGTNME